MFTVRNFLSFGAVVLLLISCYAFAPITKTNTMKTAVQEKVQAFATAIGEYDVAALETLLHPSFRVIANQYPNNTTTSLLPKATYISMIESKKIGGTKYTVQFDNITIKEHSATVLTTFKGQESSMLLTLLLVQDAEGTWRIISDMALLK